MADGSSAKLRPVKGKWSPGKGDVRYSHADGFSRALDNALSKTHWHSEGGDDFHDVKVEFSATVHVYNPGSIVEYFATVIPPGPAG